jgi:hypothetical protein
LGGGGVDIQHTLGWGEEGSGTGDIPGAHVRVAAGSHRSRCHPHGNRVLRVIGHHPVVGAVMGDVKTMNKTVKWSLTLASAGKS